MVSNTITVNNSGVQIAYTDSGVPSQSPYITVVAIHGMLFSAPVFKRVQDVAPKKGVRLIALNRRSYPGSTPFNEGDLDILVKGTKEQKDAWHRDRSHELGMFIHRLIYKENLPPISADRKTGGKTGGIVLVGWSAGAASAIGTIAHADTLPPKVRRGLASHIRSLIIQDSHRGLFGFPFEPNFYAPSADDRIPPEERPERFGVWVSSYFQHGDTSARDRDALNWIEPSNIRPASYSNMTTEEKAGMLYPGGAPYDVPYLGCLLEQFDDAYRKAFFGDNVKALFPGFKVSFLAGELSPAFAISSYWTLEDDMKKVGKPFNLKLVPDSNHFLHWDDPETALRVYLECS